MLPFKTDRNRSQCILLRPFYGRDYGEGRVRIIKITFVKNEGMAHRHRSERSRFHVPESGAIKVRDKLEIESSRDVLWSVLQVTFTTYITAALQITALSNQHRMHSIT